LPAVEPFLAGTKPAVIAVILGALWKLGKQAIRSWAMAPIGVLVLAALLAGGDEVLWLFIGAVAGALYLRLLRRGQGRKAAPLALLAAFSEGKVYAAAAGAAAAGVSLWKLGFFFLKVGAVLYGSGYVLIAFLE